MPKPAPASPQQVSIATRIAQARMQLTPSHQQIADYVLKRPLQAATMPIDELAAAVGVSVATANRFARAIGLDGYPMLRAELVKGFEAMLAPVEKMRVRLEKPGSAHDAFVAVLDESQNNIAATRAALDPSACAAAVQAVAAARRIYVLGYGASGWLAGLLARGLDMHCENVHLLSSVAGATDGARQLPRMGAQDLFIVISFPRYLRDSVALTRAAHERGVPVLALTDGAHSPLAPFARHCLFAKAESYHAVNSETTVLALIEALISAVALHTRDTVQNATRMTEAVLPWLHGAGRAGAANPAPTPAESSE
ncbi:MurR/RpiR family transcriptional regulator [Diaphorobacter sp. JS3051]|uniref:MurR/RpiR family transcriptional regulator n=1 Tax=Diaphorobacter sp. JS3051 TaxID=2792224 RepID=UPI0018CB578C|nr:MurR/RpiR family transcriptional regulator [Diaphorobacter sp. JS3051]QPN29822.1 MurR/RpiR family transcriptional regulator [Diaphorobacter sp. JS3051]